jgi:hypothetical protein
MVASMAEAAAPDIIAHFDIVRKNNRSGRQNAAPAYEQGLD